MVKNYMEHKYMKKLIVWSGTTAQCAKLPHVAPTPLMDIGSGSRCST